MTRIEAIKALDNGKTLTHTHFTNSEWVRGIGAGLYEFEDGCKCSAHEFWFSRNECSSPAFSDGWSEFLGA